MRLTWELSEPETVRNMSLTVGIFIRNKMSNVPKVSFGRYIAISGSTSGSDLSNREDKKEFEILDSPLEQRTLKELKSLKVLMV
ncbi:hypothetical protein TNIN_47321 [Trichonephila inaurata madagascariensis]|uniref:Uncharacterized protein n=1 Tax=Trichonephila inaurata madagascariensis TaxID=2747483 RepID=A0A8X6Y9C9_9ARAC|nr:hypothetical protein TNIN_47321 [Trichonephila inaurata madagascariensis]